jgi:hypothetical protein
LNNSVLTDLKVALRYTAYTDNLKTKRKRGCQECGYGHHDHGHYDHHLRPSFCDNVSINRCHSSAITANADAKSNRTETKKERKRDIETKRENKSRYLGKKMSDKINGTYGLDDITQRQQRIFKSKLVTSIRDATTSSRIREYEINNMKRQDPRDVF